MTITKRLHAVYVLTGVLWTLGAAHANTLHLPVPMSTAALLTPKISELRMACQAGLQSGLAGGATVTPLPGGPTQLSLGAPPPFIVTLLTPVGSMQRHCQRAAMDMDGHSLGDAQRATTGTLWIKVLGSSRTLQDAQNWRVALSLRDAAGQELARLEPSVVVAGRREVWSSQCAVSACTWTGENRYSFDLGQFTSAARAALPRTSQVVAELDLPAHELLAERP